MKDIRNLHVFPSQANYFLVEILNKFSSTELSTLLLNKYGIFIKDLSKKIKSNRHLLRIAIRDRNDNDRLINALNDVLL